MYKFYDGQYFHDLNEGFKNEVQIALVNLLTSIVCHQQELLIMNELYIN